MSVFKTFFYIFFEKLPVYVSAGKNYSVAYELEDLSGKVNMIQFELSLSLPSMTH